MIGHLCQLPQASPLEFVFLELLESLIHQIRPKRGSRAKYGRIAKLLSQLARPLMMLFTSSANGTPNLYPLPQKSSISANIP